MEYDKPKTENLYNKSKPIDQLNLTDGINLMVNEQKNAVTEVKKSSKSIELAIKKIIEHLFCYPDGRLIYVGAGTSGRIGVQDGIELLPTFGWDKKRLDYIIAGGIDGILNSIENAEDDVQKAKEVVNKKSICEKDIVIALAASGNTPFTCEVLMNASQKKALTIAISNNPKGKLLRHGDVEIILNTKEEVIAGSTRLKAGTAQKICLNIISSLVMTHIGRVKNGYMSHMIPTNKKLKLRKSFINSIMT